MFKKEEALKLIQLTLEKHCTVSDGELEKDILNSLMPFIEAYAEAAQEDGYSDGYNDIHGWHEKGYD